MTLLLSEQLEPGVAVGGVFGSGFLEESGVAGEDRGDFIGGAFAFVVGVAPFLLLIAVEAGRGREVGLPHVIIFVAPNAVREVDFLGLTVTLAVTLTEGKLSKLTVLRGLDGGGFEQRQSGVILALADQLEPRLPRLHQRQMAGAALLGAVAALVEPVEHGDRQAAVVTVALGDDLAVAADGLGHAVERLLVKSVGKRRAGELAGRIPAGREQGIAGAQGIGRLAGQAGIFAGERHAPGLGQHLEEQPARERRPAVAAVEGFVLVGGAVMGCGSGEIDSLSMNLYGS